MFKTQFKTRTLLIGLLAILILLDISILMDSDYLYLRSLLGFIYLVIVPGFLLFRLFNITIGSIYLKIVHYVGLSIAALMILGLFSNNLLPLLGHANPLNPVTVLTIINVLLVVCGIILFIRKKNEYFIVHIPVFSISQRFILISSFLVLTVSILSVYKLNSGGTNFLSLISLFAVATIFILSFLMIKNRADIILPAILFLLSVSLLFMTSLRGDNISGHDILDEYGVFQITKNSELWHTDSSKLGYNACLSITILPIFFSYFTGIPDAQIFKILFQIIFALVPVCVYFFIRKYLNHKLAFLGAFFFIAQYSFIDMPFLNRQEIALLFFSLFLLLFTDRKQTFYSRSILLLIYAFSMVVSHYTTTYIASALLLGSMICVFAHSIFARLNKWKFVIFRPLMKHNRKRVVVNVLPVAFLVVSSLIWYGPVTNISDQYKNIVFSSVTNLGEVSNYEYKSTQILTILASSKINIVDDFNAYMKNTIAKNRVEGIHTAYNPSLYSSYTPSLRISKTVPKSKIGVSISQFGKDSAQIIYQMRNTLAKTVVSLIIIGFLVLLFSMKKYSVLDIEILSLVSISIFLLALFVILPFSSISYGSLRFFQQMLLILSIPLLISLVFISRLIFRKSMIFASIFIAMYFLVFSGFIPQVIGGYEPDMHLNNYGKWYDWQYTHKGEIESAIWLADVRGDVTVHSDKSTYRKIWAYARIWSIMDMHPASMNSESYVFLGKSNINNDVSYISLNDITIAYNLPVAFLNNHKNIVYSNEDSVIYV